MSSHILRSPLSVQSSYFWYSMAGFFHSHWVQPAHWLHPPSRKINWCVTSAFFGACIDTIYRLAMILTFLTLDRLPPLYSLQGWLNVDRKQERLPCASIPICLFVSLLLHRFQARLTCVVLSFVSQSNILVWSMPILFVFHLMPSIVFPDAHIY